MPFVVNDGRWFVKIAEQVCGRYSTDRLFKATLADILISPQYSLLAVQLLG